LRARRAGTSLWEPNSSQRVGIAADEDRARQSSCGIKKALTGIEGLDTATGGGLPAGRPTLIAGGPGWGKTLFAMPFLLEGTMCFGEATVFANFEESAYELARNVVSPRSAATVC